MDRYIDDRSRNNVDRAEGSGINECERIRVDSSDMTEGIRDILSSLFRTRRVGDSRRSRASVNHTIITDRAGLAPAASHVHIRKCLWCLAAPRRTNVRVREIRPHVKSRNDISYGRSRTMASIVG